jgi:predicted dehydrogenase
MGQGDLREFLRIPNVECVAICDVDDTRAANGMQMVETEFNQKPGTVTRDFRHLLDRKDIDALIVATPDNWHALITVLACQAGKDVYVEKPLSLTMAEGDAMIKAARKYGRVVQAGTQYHSSEHLAEAVEYVRSGKLGNIALVRCFCYLDWMQALPSAPDSEPPATLDYDMWLGPAAWKPYNKHRLHFNFRWFWNSGAGLLGDWGVHLLDIALWGMDAKEPLSAASLGGKYAFPSDFRETPDAQQVLFEYPNFALLWEHAMGHNLGPHGKPTGISFYGSEGMLIADWDGWEVIPESTAYFHTTDNWKSGYFKRTLKGAGVAPQPSRGKDARAVHVRNFLDCMKTRKRPNADVEICHNTMMLCHLGNIAQRTGRKVVWDSAGHRIKDHAEAQVLTGREFRMPWAMPTL